MHVSRGLQVVVLSALSSALALTPRSASAASFTLHTVDYSQAESFTAGDDLGNYIINANASPIHPCGQWAPSCYKVGSVDSTSTYFTSTLPALGKGATSGSVVPGRPVFGANWDVTGQLGGIFAATYSSGDFILRGIFDGTDPLKDYLGKGSIDGGLVSAGGNVFFIDGLHDSLVVAIDSSITTAPEPGTLTLLGSGASGLMALLARRRRLA